jgi:hypothetical protein
MLCQKRLGRGKCRHVVHGPSEAVTFVGRQQVLDRKSAIAQRDHDLLRFRLLDAWIVGALDDKQRRLDLCSRVQRRLEGRAQLERQKSAFAWDTLP